MPRLFSLLSCKFLRRVICSIKDQSISNMDGIMFLFVSIKHADQTNWIGKNENIWALEPQFYTKAWRKRFYILKWPYKSLNYSRKDTDAQRWNFILVSMWKNATTPNFFSIQINNTLAWFFKFFALWASMYINYKYFWKDHLWYINFYSIATYLRN